MKTFVLIAVLLCVPSACAVEPIEESVGESVEAVTTSICLVPAACDDGNPCTNDTCRSWGCNHWPMQTGSLCSSDGLAGVCTKDGVCDTSNSPECLINADCDDGIACTVDTCDITTCQNTPANGGSVCYVGACTGTCFAPSGGFPGVCGGCE